VVFPEVALLVTAASHVVDALEIMP